MGKARRRFLPEVLVLLLLAAAVLAWRFDLGPRWFGTGADPVRQPAAVLPPDTVKLPAPTGFRRVARTARPGKADPAKVSAAVAPMLRPKVLGPHFSALVADLSDGTVVYRGGAPSFTPASTLKLLTSVAALKTVGPSTRFTTSVRFDAATKQLTLVGGGDPLLASSPAKAAGQYPARADLGTLASATAAALKDQQVTTVRLRYDATLFSGPAVNPAWPPSYIPEGVTAPTSALWADEGHDTSGYRFVADPALSATQEFAAALRAQGIKVRGRLLAQQAPPSASSIASVRSRPLSEIVEHTLAVSDNQAAEVIARHVGLAVGNEGSATAGAASVLRTIKDLGVDTSGDHTFDGSGLSRQNLMRPETEMQTLRAASAAANPELRAALTGLPVAGFTGSLKDRFAHGPPGALGRVRAKTGTLSGVHGLAGLTADADGTQMVFVIVADQVKPLQSYKAEVLIDRIAGALGACHCGVGSGA